MHSPPSTLDSLEAALERAVARFDDGSATGSQIRYHFGFGEDGGAGRRGKRLRSRLVLEVAEEEGGRADEALAAACAVEIIHEFSLIHDDIEDGDTPAARSRDALGALRRSPTASTPATRCARWRTSPCSTRARRRPSASSR